MKAYWKQPVGWRGESYRHYLARKGIATRYQAHKYFVKGDYRELPAVDPVTGETKNLIKVGHAKGLTDDQMRMNYGLPVPEAASKKVDFAALASRAMPGAVNEVTTPTQFTSLVAEPVPQIEPVAPPVAPVSAATPITPEVIESPLPSASELEVPDEEEEVSAPVVPVVSPGLEEGLVGEDNTTAGAPELVNFDNFGSS